MRDVGAVTSYQHSVDTVLYQILYNYGIEGLDVSRVFTYLSMGLRQDSQAIEVLELW
jgi:hypothetical protein